MKLSKEDWQEIDSMIIETLTEFKKDGDIEEVNSWAEDISGTLRNKLNEAKLPKRTFDEIVSELRGMCDNCL